MGLFMTKFQCIIVPICRYCIYTWNQACHWKLYYYHGRWFITSCEHYFMSHDIIRLYSFSYSQSLFPNLSSKWVIFVFDFRIILFQITRGEWLWHSDRNSLLWRGWSLWLGSETKTNQVRSTYNCNFRNVKRTFSTFFKKTIFSV